MAKQSKRIYIVREDGALPVRLIRAPNKSQAIGYVVRDVFTAEVATQEDLITLLKNVAVEDASDQPSGQAGE